MKEKFYVFLDIDGTLWDYSFLRKTNSLIYKLNPDSVDAINRLIKKIDEKFDCELVITSQRRKDWDECKNFLLSSGLKYDKELKRIKVNDKKPRGIKIAEYMENDLKGREFVNHKNFNPIVATIKTRVIAKKMSQNFVVIDDNMNPLIGLIPYKNIVKTDINYESFNMAMANRIINQFVNSDLENDKNSNSIKEESNNDNNVNDKNSIKDNIASDKENEVQNVNVDDSIM